MAVPLIITVQPPVGSTSGGNVVEVKTNDARLPPEPPATGLTNGIVPETVQILFGTTPGTNVKVVSRGRVLVQPPVSDPGVVDVTIKNLDDNGDPIAGEEFTKANAYTFARPDLSRSSEHDLTRLVRALLRDMKRQIMDNVSITVHTDFDSTTGDLLNIAETAEMPGLILVGPDLSENRFFSINRGRVSDFTNTDLSRDELLLKREPYTVDVAFTIIGVAELTHQLMQLMHLTVQYFHRNKYFVLDKDGSDPSQGTVRYEMDWTDPDGEPDVTSRLNDSNVRSFSGSFLIRGFDLEDFAGLTDDTVIDKSTRITEVELQVDTETPEAPAEDPLPFPFDLDDLPPAPDIGPFEVNLVESDE